MEVLVAAVDDGAVLAAGADVANTLCGDEEHKNERTQKMLQLERVERVSPWHTLVYAAISTAFSVDTPSLG